MQNWKKAIVFGAIGVGAVLLARRRAASTAFIAAGLAVLASEYPEKFEAVWDIAPDYVRRGVQIFGALEKLTEGIAETAERRGVSVWRNTRS